MNFYRVTGNHKDCEGYYYNILGQVVNFHLWTSSQKELKQEKHDIMDVLQVPSPYCIGTFLDARTLILVRDFEKINERISNKLVGWKARTLLQEGQTVHVSLFLLCMHTNS